jgi:nicotinamide mononucleotide transporter
MDLLFQPAFTAFGAPTSWLELIAVILAFACVAYNVTENPWGWPLAFVSSLLYVLVFYRSKLYGDAGVQVYFALAALWAWWVWLFGKRRDHHAVVRALQVERLDRRGLLFSCVAFAVLWPLISIFLKRFTDTDVPYADGFVTAGSVVGQILLGRKYIENWIVWMVVNLTSIVLLSYKQLYLSAGLYVVFVGMAVLGWRRWRAKLAKA